MFTTYSLSSYHQCLTSSRISTCSTVSFRNAARNSPVRLCPQDLRTLSASDSLEPLLNTSPIFSSTLFFRLNYTWINQDRKSVQLPAPTYIDYVMTWVQNVIDDETTFPTKSGQSWSIPHSCIIDRAFTHNLSFTLFHRTRLPSIVPRDHETRLSPTASCFRPHLPRSLFCNPSPTFRTSLQLPICALPRVWQRI